MAKKGQKPHLYLFRELLKLLNDNKKQKWEVKAIVDY
jgi:lipopolysaccharide export system protein LptC